VLAYQGFMAYIYLADRATCPNRRQICDWNKPPRFEEDVIPVLNAFYRSNRSGRPVRKLKGTIDLIFTRQPVGAGENALPFQIFDGQDLVAVNDYLIDHPRPDLNERIRWLSAGPYGNRAGDIVLLPRACTNLLVQDRYFLPRLPTTLGMAALASRTVTYLSYSLRWAARGGQCARSSEGSVKIHHQKEN
jgi:hypothetical protein